MNPPQWPGQPGGPGYPPAPPGPPPGPPLPGPPGPPMGFPPPPQRGGGGALVPLLIIGVVAVLGIVGVGAFFILRDDDKPDRTVVMPSLTHLNPSSGSTYSPLPTPTTSLGGGTGDPSTVLSRTIRTAKGHTFTQAGVRTESCTTRANAKLLTVLRTHPCVGLMHSAVYANPTKTIITSVSIMTLGSSSAAITVKGATDQSGWPKLLTPSDASGLPQPRANPAYWTRTWSQGRNVIYAQSYWKSGGPTGGRTGSVFATAGELGVEVTNTLLFSN
ncbi:hypothetical protein F8568_037800 [Actinomadura sp. LD22]|uniref:Uncharacterized protein n=1 Tax=Actinomadura physcomitrii TaxID=2650748 RepID=A0A6I4MM39_9ACTN|nr:hypothetical protein [Actinomadura physcomitrii]MWA06010.1 hypothetical protein [Actinomadura physcomitrii]